MEKLNSDAKMQILMKLSGDEIVKVCQASKDLYRACNDERYTPLWRQKIKDEFNIEYNGERGYDKYRDLRTIFGTTYYIVKIINTDQNSESYSKIFITKEQAENYIVMQLSEFFTYSQVKSALKAGGDFLQHSYRLFSIEEERMEPVENLHEDERNYNKEYEKFKTFKDFDQLFYDTINSLNSDISQGVSGKKLDKRIDFFVDRLVFLSPLHSREEVKNFIMQNILLEREDE